MEHNKQSDESMAFSPAPPQLYEDIDLLLGDNEEYLISGQETSYTLRRGADGELLVYFVKYDETSKFCMQKMLVVQSDGISTWCGLQYTNFSASDFMEPYNAADIARDRETQGELGITRISHDELQGIWQDMLHVQRQELFNLAAFAHEFTNEPNVIQGKNHMYRIVKTEDDSFCLYFTGLDLANEQTDWILEISNGSADNPYEVVLYRDNAENDDNSDLFCCHYLHLNDILTIKREIETGILAGLP